MASPRVIKFPASDKDSVAVIVQVKSHGRKSLDLRLVATESCAPYVCILKHDRVASLRVNNCPVSPQEWEDVLGSVLRDEHLDGIHTTATVKSYSSLSLTVRKQVQGVTQRLGVIDFTCDETEPIQLYDWCGTALDALAESKAAAQASAARARELEAAVSDLQTQLDELVQAKQEDETVLLHKFQDLINEKKVRIREQQKMILAALSQRNEASCAEPEVKVKSETSPQPTTKTKTRAARRPAPSRRSKRKAKSPSVESDSSSNQEPALDDKSSEEAQETESDAGNESDRTASTAESDDAVAPERTTSAPGRGQASRQPQGQAPAAQKEAAKPPPPRSLPFMKSNAVATAVTEHETDSDDEL